MTIQEAKQALERLQKKMSAYDHACGLLYYDGVTTAPRDTASNRAQTMAVLTEELYLLSTGEDTVSLLEFLDAHREALDLRERRTVELLLKDIRMMQQVPMEEYVRFQRLIMEADDVWHRSKEANDWPLFEPVLEQLFAFHKKIAGYCAPDKAPYDYWLDRYEEGLDMAGCDRFFATLRAHIVPLLERVRRRPQLDNSILKGSFPAEAQMQFSLRLMELIGLDLNHVGLSTTEHPFTCSLGSHLDERITTKFHEDDFSNSMFSVIHEGGHALYDTGSDGALAYTALDCGVSMGIHESQSRFYENILARSLPFCEYILPVAQEYFPALEGRTARELYQAVNRAQPGPIRIEADELTYALHIMIRYELEKQVFAGTLAVRDLPEAWNRMYLDYLGVQVPDDSHGVLQDSHWAGGNIGYFPSYALGSAYGAQFLRKMRESVDVDGCLRRGDFGPINAWLRERIWKYGCTFQPGALFRQAVGEDFDPTVFTAYLEDKYTRLYGLD